MIGRVEALQVLMPVTLRVGGQNLEMEFVVDTGFTGFLTLPEAAVSALQLPYLEDTPASLADDSSRMLPVHAGRIIWDGADHDVRVIATGRRPLLGTALLAGRELRAEFIEEGNAQLTPLPPGAGPPS